jgi:hypothetical protein
MIKFFMPHELTIKHPAQSVLTEKDVQHCRDTQTEFVNNTINCREQLLSRWFPSLVGRCRAPFFWGGRAWQCTPTTALGFVNSPKYSALFHPSNKISLTQPAKTYCNYNNIEQRIFWHEYCMKQVKPGILLKGKNHL